MITDQQPSTVDKQTLSEIVGFVWAMFTDEQPTPVEDAKHGEGLCATISIGGPWTATLEVALSEGLAGRFAASLLGIKPDELTREDIDDAVGELANVVGGNVKGLLDDGGVSTLSLPVVSHSSQSVTGGQLTISSAFDCTGGVMIWSLFERP